MYLQTLCLSNFRNYREQQVEFTAPKTIIVGDNAQGKSNLLEAVEVLALLRSHRVSRDRDLVCHTFPAARVAALINRTYGQLEVALMLRQQGRRTAIRNGENLRRQLDFLGCLNAVQFSSTDLDLVRGSPDVRRQWLDSLVMQLEPVYAHILQQYHQVLKQRNALLRQGKRDRALASPLRQTQLAVWDAQLATHGTRVTRRRARVLARLAPLAQTWHADISGNLETLTVHYQPNVQWSETGASDTAAAQMVQQAFLEQLQQRRTVEADQGRTLVGPHRDEIDLQLNGTPARQFASQGQQRTLVLALKMAELKLIEAVVGEPPLLLLDDVLAELDLRRQHHLLNTIQDRFQTLITTTHVSNFDAHWLQSSQILAVRSGHISPYAGT